MTLLKKSLIATLLTLATALQAQPSFGIEVELQLYDEHGLVDYGRFCTEYELYSKGSPYSISPCDNKNIYRPYFYVDSQKLYHFKGTVVYNDFVFQLVRGLDTMEVLVPTLAGQKGKHKIGKLQFAKGWYRLYDSNLDSLDFAKSRSDYFHQFLAQVNFDKSQLSDWQESYYYRQLMRLKEYYGIKESDDEEKDISYFMSSPQYLGQ